MYKQGPAGHEECELNCSGKGDVITELGRATQITLEQGSSSMGFLSLRCWGGPGSGLRFSSSHFILTESAQKINQALADNM